MLITIESHFAAVLIRASINVAMYGELAMQVKTKNQKYKIIVVIVMALFAFISALDAFMDYQVHQQLRQSNLELRQKVLELRQEVLEFRRSNLKLRQEILELYSILIDFEAQ